MKTLDKEEGSVGTAKYSSTKELSLEYMESDSGRLRSTKRKADLDVWFGLNSALLVLNSTKKDEVRNPNSVARFLIVRNDC